MENFHIKNIREEESNNDGAGVLAMCFGAIGVWNWVLGVTSGLLWPQFSKETTSRTMNIIDR